ncbi:hypothetical protein BCV71DRAFT_257869 [Rhizopus microsporus]|uniref:Uncharacterized protein n=1 Tax=Rhizopus microsporus TaxID=58291 RepID=A0A1X0RRF2_RHIZD|nr:hypothetical protein BCV71DRAFT_257869 [Rhizopus microsporus]
MKQHPNESVSFILFCSCLGCPIIAEKHVGSSITSAGTERNIRQFYFFRPPYSIQLCISRNCALTKRAVKAELRLRVVSSGRHDLRRDIASADIICVVINLDKITITNLVNNPSNVLRVELCYTLQL